MEFIKLLFDFKWQIQLQLDFGEQLLEQSITINNGYLIEHKHSLCSLICLEITLLVCFHIPSSRTSIVVNIKTNSKAQYVLFFVIYIY